MKKKVIIYLLKIDEALESRNFDLAKRRIERTSRKKLTQGGCDDLRNAAKKAFEGTDFKNIY